MELETPPTSSGSTHRDRLTVICGDALSELASLESESVQCCVTSPPYWGLRDYGFCSCRKHRIQHASSTLAGTQAGTPNHVGEPRSDCPICDGSGRIVGTENQIGLETTPAGYVKRLVALFSEVRRVLRADGTLWLNLGDSYSGSGKGGGTGVYSSKQLTNRGSLGLSEYGGNVPNGLKPKDLVGIPWRVAFALQAGGWYLRSDIIWHKPNPMPESVTDRPTKSHEYLFLLTKSERYFYDAEAIKEEAEYREDARPFGDAGGNRHGDEESVYDPRASWKGSSFHLGKTGVHQLGRSSRKRGEFNGKTNAMPGREAFRAFTMTRNKRSVWTVATHPYSEAHFATFPPDLIKPCILAGSKVGDTILDPFAGSGTTGMVALELARKAVLIELNPEYVKLIHERCNVTPGLPLEA